ncbi:DUF4406 domain-containing protein [Glaciihabitans sp. UYNi722]|uniref:DUF4406 domain-containing protein n=1 Tax=Glaciihabitans sp. UYNi722 TaxID=3156344 RepID=UPI0033986C1B
MKVYIAGPMTGLPDFNYPAFRDAETHLTARGLTALCPADSEQHNTTGAPQPWDWYMRHALRMVIDSDAVCLLPGWQTSNGANLEVTVAEALGLDIRPLDEWMKVKAS